MTKTAIANHPMESGKTGPWVMDYPYAAKGDPWRGSLSVETKGKSGGSYRATRAKGEPWTGGMFLPLSLNTHEISTNGHSVGGWLRTGFLCPLLNTVGGPLFINNQHGL